MAEYKSPNKPEDKARITQIIPAFGWRVYEFSQGDGGKLTSKEVPVIGWGLQDNGDISLLIPHPNEPSGHAVISINDAPASVGQKCDLKFIHYQAISPFQHPSDAEREAQFVLNFVSSNIKAADDRTNGKSAAIA